MKQPSPRFIQVPIKTFGNAFEGMNQKFDALRQNLKSAESTK